MLKVLMSTALVSLMMLAFTGCAESAKTMVTYDRGRTPPPLMNAAEAGEYSLLSANSPNALYTTALDQNDEYGFTRADDGKVYGVAKGKTIPLENVSATAYYWKYLGAKKNGSSD